MTSDYMADLHDQLEEAVFDDDPEQFTVSVDCSVDAFNTYVVPFAVGYAGDSHGLTAMDHFDQSLTFERVQE